MKRDDPPRGTILIVDDDPVNLGVLNEFLKDAGFSVLLARNGDECLESARLGGPDAILLDVLMPGPDGYAICERLKRMPETREIPVIFLSVLTDPEHALKGFDAGGVDYIAKPFRRQEVLARVSTHAAIRRRKTELKALNRRLEAEVREKNRLAATLAEKERRLNEAQAIAAVGSWERDLATDAGRWSDNQFRLFGYEPGEVTPCFDLFKRHVHPEDLDRVLAVIGGCIEKGHPYDTDYRYIPVSGEVRYAHAIGTVERDDEGRPIRIRGTLQDITERKRRENELKWLHDRLDGILKHTPNIVCVLDEEGRYLHINPAGQRALGLPEARIIGKSCRNLLPPDTADLFLRRIREVLAADEPMAVEDTLVLDGGETHFTTVLFPLFRHGGRATAVGGVAMDVTERKNAERDRLEMERRLQSLRRQESLGVMAGGIAHDFNNLLMAILGNIEMVKHGLAPDASGRELLRESEKAIHRATDLVRQMLAYTGKGGFSVQSVDPAKLIESSVGTIKSAVSGKASTRFDLAAGLPHIQGDPVQLRQLLVHLAVNAAESYGEKGNGGAVVIAAGVDTCGEAELSSTLSDLWMGYDPPFRDGRYLWIEVRDRGEGIDPEARKQIFDPFYTTKFQGRGLGLAAVLGIVRCHRGYIRVDSEPGWGTTIRVLLPARPAGDPERTVPPPARPPSETEADADRILLVDDEASVRDLVGRMLERLGYTVLAAASGPEALELFAERPGDVDLVLLDLTMPGMNGLETLEVLRRVDPEIPVVLSSGYGEEDLGIRYGDAGFDGFLPKPYRAADLETLLRKILGRA